MASCRTQESRKKARRSINCCSSSIAGGFCLLYSGTGLHNISLIFMSFFFGISKQRSIFVLYEINSSGFLFISQNIHYFKRYLWVLCQMVLVLISHLLQLELLVRLIYSLLGKTDCQ